MNFDPRLVQRLTRPLKRPGVTNHRMAEGLIERFQALGNRLPLLDQQLSRWATTVEFDEGEVPIVYVQVSELDDQEIGDFRGDLVAARKEVRSPIQNSPIQNSPIQNSPVPNLPIQSAPVPNLPVPNSPVQNSIEKTEMPVVQQQEASSSPITSVEPTSVMAVKPIATQDEQPLSQISDRPQISSIPATAQIVSNPQPEISQPLVMQPVSEGVIQARHDNNAPSVIDGESLISKVSDAPIASPSLTTAIGVAIATAFNSALDPNPLVPREIPSTSIAPIEASVTTAKAIASETTPVTVNATNVAEAANEPVITAKENLTIKTSSLIEAVSQPVSFNPAIASPEQELSFVQPPQNPNSSVIAQDLPTSSERSLAKPPVLPVDLPLVLTTDSPIEVAQIAPTSDQTSDRPQIPITPISNSPSILSSELLSELSSEPLSFATNTFLETSEPQPFPLPIPKVNTNYSEPTVPTTSNTQPEISRPLVIQPVSEGIIQARYDRAAPSIINGEPLISIVSDAPTAPLVLETAIAAPLTTEFNSASDAMPLVAQEVSDRSQISSTLPIVQIVPNPQSIQPEISQPLVIQPVSEGVIQARYDSATPSIIDAQPVISTVAEPWSGSLPEVPEISWTSSENPQNPMPIVNANPVTLSLPALINASVESSVVESSPLIKVPKIDAQSIQNQPDSLVQTIIQEPSFFEQPMESALEPVFKQVFEPVNLEASTVKPNLVDQNMDKPTVVNITTPTIQAVYSSQDSLVFTPSNPTLNDENQVVATPIISKANSFQTSNSQTNNSQTNNSQTDNLKVALKVSKAIEPSLSPDTQKQIKSSPVITQIARETVFTYDSSLPLAIENPQDSQPTLTPTNNNLARSSPVFPTVQVIAEASEQTFEPLLLSRHSSHASASEIRGDHLGQGQPNSKAIANSSNVTTYRTASSSSSTNISPQSSPPQSSIVTNPPNQDANALIKPQNIPELRTANMIDMDSLVAQVERKIIKRLIVEGERRGTKKWL